MKSPCRNICKIDRFYLLLTAISISISILNLNTINLFAQTEKNNYEFSFVRYSDTLKTAELYFNVARIVNKSTKPVIGEVNFSGPENWKIFSFPSVKITINPGDTAWVPVRVSPNSDAIGGITYIINSTFKTDESVLSENAYVTLPSKTKWDFSVSNSSIFFTEYSPNVSF